MQGSCVASPSPVASTAASAASSATASERGLSPFDRWAVTALLVLQLGLRIGLATRQRFNSDEPQHYHVAWGWSRGLLPYRDLFDNHTPLFHLLASPLVVLFGEHPDVLVWARWAMIPVVAISLAAIYRIGKALFSRRVGAWSAALAGLIPSFLTTSLEFRADVLWVALWLGALATALSGLSDRPRFLLAGLLVGAASAASIKTALLLVALLGGAATALALDPHRSGSNYGRKAIFAPSLALAVAGALAVLVPIASLLFYLGVLDDFVRCVVLHNLRAVSLWSDRLLRAILALLALPLLLLTARRAFDGSPRAFARVSLLLATGFYALLLNGFSPIVSRQDWLPLYALGTVFLVALTIAVEKRRPAARVARWLLVVAALEVSATVCVDRPWRDDTRAQRALVADILHLTRPADYVMDVKGEALFRRRAYYPVLETITLARILNGELRDDIADRLVATRTNVVTNDNERFPPAGRDFMLDNYLPVGALRVAGKLLVVDAAGRSEFTLALPGRYAMLSPIGSPVGALDGKRMTEPRELDAGAHVVDGAVPALPLALLWADAAERGLSPFFPAEPQ